MNNPLVSIVLPVYGVEQYIERCARSIFEQTYENLEIIFVNDCTLDKSMEIIQRVVKDYPNRINQLFIIDKFKNEGLGIARGDGMRYVHGVYVMHLDSDDWVDPGMVENMVALAVDEHADMVYADYFITDETRKEAVISSCEVSNGIEYLKALFSRKVSATTWTKLYHKKLFKDIQFPKYFQFEDVVMNVQTLVHASKVVHLPKPYYHYHIFIKPMTQVVLDGAYNNIIFIHKYIHDNNLQELINPFSLFIEGRKVEYILRHGVKCTPYSCYLWTFSPDMPSHWLTIIRGNGYKVFFKYLYLTVKHQFVKDRIKNIK